MMHPGHSRSCSLALSWMFASFLSLHLSMTWIWRTSLSLECITHYLFISSPTKTHSHPSQTSSRFYDLVSPSFPCLGCGGLCCRESFTITLCDRRFSDLWPPCSFFLSSSTISFYLWSSSSRLGRALVILFTKFVTWAFNIIRDDGLSPLCDHILHLPVKLRSCRLQFRFQCFNFTPASIFTLFTFFPASTCLTLFLFLPLSFEPSSCSLWISWL